MRKKRSNKISIKLSSALLLNNICKHCGGSPIKSGLLYLKDYYSGINSFKEDTLFFQNMLKPNYTYSQRLSSQEAKLAGMPQYNMSFYSVKHYKTFMQSTKNNIDDSRANKLKYLICKCEKTRWVYYNDELSVRPDIINRQSFKKY